MNEIKDYSKQCIYKSHEIKRISLEMVFLGSSDLFWSGIVLRESITRSTSIPLSCGIYLKSRSAKIGHLPRTSIILRFV